MQPHDLAVDHIVSTPELYGLGLDSYAIRRLCQEGRLRRLIRGWFAVASDLERPPWSGKDDYQTRESRHRLLTCALLRSFDGRVAASHQSSVVMQGGRVWKSDLTTAHVERTADDHSRHRRGAVIHPRIAPSLVRVTEGYEFEDGYLCVPPAIAAVQVGLVSTTAALPQFPLESLIAAEGFLWDEVITRADLNAAIELYDGVPGIRAVRRILEHASTGSESVGETRLVYDARVLGYKVEQQWKVPGTNYRVDGKLVDENVILEFDGISKYLKGIENPTEDDIKRALDYEKRRQDDLLGMGYGVGRFRWEVLDNLREIERRIEALRRQARRLAA